MAETSESDFFTSVALGSAAANLIHVSLINPLVNLNYIYKQLDLQTEICTGVGEGTFFFNICQANNFINVTGGFHDHGIRTWVFDSHTSSAFGWNCNAGGGCSAFAEVRALWVLTVNEEIGLVFNKICTIIPLAHATITDQWEGLDWVSSLQICWQPNSLRFDPDGSITAFYSLFFLSLPSNQSRLLTGSQWSSSSGR